MKTNEYESLNSESTVALYKGCYSQSALPLTIRSERRSTAIFSFFLKLKCSA
jgi:hypothetical protein